MALFILISLALPAFAEAERDLIEKAYGLAQQKQRPQALKLLTDGIAKRKLGATHELQAALEDIATSFIGDKAQQAFELAISLKASDPSAAQAKMTEAFKAEPDNQAILTELGRICLALGDVSNAQKYAQLALAQNPLAEGSSLVLAQAHLSIGQFDQIEKLKPTDFKKSKLAAFWHLVDIEKLFKTGKIDEALSYTIELTQKIKAGKLLAEPEIDYWQWRLAQQLKESDEKAALRYISECKKLSVRQIRDMAADPGLCKHTTEVDNFLKKSHNTEI